MAAASPAPTGTWLAVAPASQFSLTFGPGNVVTLDVEPDLAIGTQESGTFRTEGDLVYLDLPEQPMVLKPVNDTYQSTSLGSMLTFARQQLR